MTTFSDDIELGLFTASFSPGHDCSRISRGVGAESGTKKMEEEVRSLPSVLGRRSLEEIFNHVRGALFYIFRNICLCYGCVSRETLGRDNCCFETP